MTSINGSALDPIRARSSESPMMRFNMYDEVTQKANANSSSEFFLASVIQDASQGKVVPHYCCYDGPGAIADWLVRILGAHRLNRPTRKWEGSCSGSTIDKCQIKNVGPAVRTESSLVRTADHDIGGVQSVADSFTGFMLLSGSRSISNENRLIPALCGSSIGNTTGQIQFAVSSVVDCFAGPVDLSGRSTSHSYTQARVIGDGLCGQNLIVCAWKTNPG
jgi:hypothetical protein